MKYAVILFALGACYVSLPIASPVVVLGQSTETEPNSANKPAASDAEKNGKPQAKAETATKTESPADKQVEKPAEKKAEKKNERKTAKAKAKRLRVVVTLDGTFTAEKMTPIALRPEEWSKFEIEEIVPHGAEVHAGQTLVKFEREDFEEELAEIELQLHVSELAIRKAEEELPRLEKSLNLAATQAERNDKNSREDYDRFYKIDRPMLLKSIEYNLKSAKFQVDYQQDELDQLEKMYEADDLTEETEEIVLTRSRTQLEFAKFNLEQTEQYVDELRNILLPRYEIEIKESLDRTGLSLARAKAALALDVNRARYELEQQKQSRTKAFDRHVKLLADRKLLELKAPAEGIVYYGECEDGDWSDMASLISKLKPHGNVGPGTVIMTIIERRPLEVLAQAGEAQRPDLKVGQAAKVVPPVTHAEWLPAKLDRLSAVPVATGKFNVAFDLTGSELPGWIVAGMSCKVKVATFDKDDALVVPKKAVHTDKDDEEVKYVWLVDSKDADAKPERRVVKVGRTSGENVEITDGLKAGDVISLDDEEQKDDAE